MWHQGTFPNFRTPSPSPLAWTPGPAADLRIAPLLRADARTVRQAAAIYFTRSPNPAALDALEQALQAETDAGLVVSLREAIRCTRAASGA